MSDAPESPVYHQRRYSLPQIGGETQEVEWYEPGGLHPVHLGDKFDDRYKIVHKLGAGGYSTVWLARDETEHRWVALKILMANQSAAHTAKNKVCKATLQDRSSPSVVVHEREFSFDGPNGHHLCLVLPVLGPATADLSYRWESRLTPALARRVAHSATRAIADLHAAGLCHGDLTTGNLLLGVSNLDEYSEDEIHQIFGKPKTAGLFKKGEGWIHTADDIIREGEDALAGPEGPRYVVKNMSFVKTTRNFLLPEVKLVDFDQSFPVSSPPDECLATPIGNLAPEVAMGRAAGPASDVWALGCCILRLRSGDGPFEAPFEASYPECQVEIIRETLGTDPPQEWKDSVLYDSWGRPTKDALKGEKTDWPVPKRFRRSVRDQIFEIWDEPKDRTLQIDGLESELDEWYAEKGIRPYAPHFASMIWRPKAIRLNDSYLGAGYGKYWKTISPALPKISTHEAELLIDLLEKIFVYLPEDRPTAREILNHPWFHLDGTIDLETDASRPVSRKSATLDKKV